MRKALRLLVFVSALALTACGKAVPSDKSAYVGEWRAQKMALLITQDGRVAYKRFEGAVTKSVDGPLQGFEGNNFKVGVAFLSTTFEVSKPPFQEGGKWKMVVDGVELTKVQ